MLLGLRIFPCLLSLIRSFGGCDNRGRLRPAVNGRIARLAMLAQIDGEHNQCREEEYKLHSTKSGGYSCQYDSSMILLSRCSHEQGALLFIDSAVWEVCEVRLAPKHRIVVSRCPFGEEDERSQPEGDPERFQTEDSPSVVEQWFVAQGQAVVTSDEQRRNALHTG